jgi:hypothetical protein
MATKTLSSKENELVIEIKIPLETSMLDGEQTLEKSLNEAGALASGALKGSVLTFKQRVILAKKGSGSNL